MNLLDYILPFVLALGILIMVHEFGHYLVARLCGVKVLRFSLGFRRPLLVRKAGADQTEWVLAAFPLGGYVKMLDEREAPVAAHELHRAFKRQSVWRRIAVVAAGPLANFLLAIVLYWGLYTGGVEELRPRLAEPEAATPASHAGFQGGDLVRSVNGEAVETWQEFRWKLLNLALDKQVETVETVNPSREIGFRKLDLAGVVVDQAEGDVTAQLGLSLQRPKLPAVLGRLSAGGPAESAGLKAGDRVLQIADSRIESWSELVAIVRDAPGRTLEFAVLRDGREERLPVVPSAVDENGRSIGRIGAALGTEEERMVSFDADEKTYQLIKFRKTNQSTSINLKPIVRKGDRVKLGQVLCEGYATQNGELALGRNLKVAFMPWKGYNFEDAMVISEKVVRDDIFTSIHIDDYSLEVRDTKLSNEELTNDIPNVSEEATKDLDENGMIRIGAEVKPGDILIGKITPKRESDPTPEEKLLRAIFGDKAGDVKDASLKASPSLHGVVLDKKLFARAVKDKRKRTKDKDDLAELEMEFETKFVELKDKLVEKLFNNAALREQLRGLPEETQIEEAAAELLGLPFDQAQADAEFRDTLEKLRDGEQKRHFEQLQAKALLFGVAGLSAEEKQRYIQLLSSRQNRS